MEKAEDQLSFKSLALDICDANKYNCSSKKVNDRFRIQEKDSMNSTRNKPCLEENRQLSASTASDVQGNVKLKTRTGTLKRIFHKNKSNLSEQNVSTKETKYTTVTTRSDQIICKTSSPTKIKASKKQTKQAIAENAELRKSLTLLKAENEKKLNEVETLTKHLESLEQAMTICNKKINTTEKMEKERDALRKHLLTSQTENENLELEIAFLQEEKEEIDKEIRALSAEYERLQEKCHDAEKYRDQYKKRHTHNQARVDQVIKDITNDLCDLSEENKFLKKHGLKGKLENYGHILKTTKDFTDLQADKNRLIVQLEKGSSRIVSQEVYIAELQMELAAAVNQLMKAGLPYESHVIGDAPQLYDLHKEPVDGNGSKAPPTPNPGATGGDGQGQEPAAQPQQFDPSKLLFNQMNQMKDQMNQKIIEPASKKVQEGLDDLNPAERMKKMKPSLAGAAMRAMPSDSLLGKCCQQCCACLRFLPCCNL